MIDVYTYDSGLPGKTLLLLGAIHGNEPCGPIAIKKLINELETGKRRLKTGKLLCIPICNPKAYQLGVRQVEKNLNRAFKPGWNPYSYEGMLAKEIRPRIDQADYVLDFHSISRGTDRFLFKSDDGDLLVSGFARYALVPTVLAGSRKLYEDTGEWATEDYAYNQGKKGLCIECGQHNDPQSPIVAHDTCVNIMRFLGLLSGTPQENTQQKTIEFTQMFYKQKKGTFAKDRIHGDVLMQGDVIVQYDDGTQEICEEDNTIMLLPKPRAVEGGEWYFLGREIL